MFFCLADFGFEVQIRPTNLQLNTTDAEIFKASTKDDLSTEASKNVGSSDFPGGPPTKYSPGLAVLSFGVRMGSSICTEA